MPPARVPIPPYLLSPSWASTTLPPRYLRAVLRLPGELRPIALRSFYSIAYRAQLQQVAANSVQHEIPLNGVNRSHAFLAGIKRDDRKELGGVRGDAERQDIGRSGGHEGVGSPGMSQVIGSSNGGKKTGDSGLSEGIGIPGGTGATERSELPGNAAPQLPSSLILTQPDGVIPEEVERIVSTFLERNPTTEIDVTNTYIEYRKVLRATKFGFIAQHFPTVICSLSRGFFGKKSLALLAVVLAGIPTTKVSSGLKTVLKGWCLFLAKPVLKWCDSLEKIESPDPSFQEVRVIARKLVGRHFSTTESIAHAYQGYRAELLATEHGYIFSDFPGQLQQADLDQFHFLRGRVDEERKRLEQTINVEEKVANPALATHIFNMSLRRMAVKPLWVLIDRSWELDHNNNRIIEAFGRLKAVMDLGKSDEFSLPKRMGPNSLKAIMHARMAVKKKLAQLQANSNTAKFVETQDQLQKRLVALHEFFEVFEDSAAIKPVRKNNPTTERSVHPKLAPPTGSGTVSVARDLTKRRKPELSTASPVLSQTSNDNALRQHITTLRSKLFDTHRDTSRDMLEDEMRRLERSFLASSSRASFTEDIAPSDKALVAPSIQSERAKKHSASARLRRQATSATTRAAGQAEEISPQVSRSITSNGSVGGFERNGTSSSMPKASSFHENALVIINPIATERPDSNSIGQDSIDLNENWARARRKPLTDHVAQRQTPDDIAGRLSATNTSFGQEGGNGFRIRRTVDTPISEQSLEFQKAVERDFQRREAMKQHLRIKENQNPAVWRPSLLNHERSQTGIPSSFEPIVPGTTPDVITQTSSTNQPIRQSSSDSAAISELKSHVAELKDLIRGLIFQQMTRPAPSPASSTPPVSMPPEIMRLVSVVGNSKSVFEKILAEPSTTSPTASKESTQIIADAQAHIDSAFSDSPLWESSPSEASRASAAKTTQSLLEELFPEESKQVLMQEVTERPSAVPRIPVPHMPLNPSEEAGAVHRKSTEHDRRKRPTQKAKPLSDTSTVLELRYASKSLTEDDFRRLIPRGLHMQEWTQRGEFVKVFPKRDPWTLDQTGNYYIIFSNEEDAKAYREHVHHVHDLARQHTPTSLTSELAPPPGYIINGEDVSALVRSFSLIPPQQKLYLHSLAPPFNPFQQNIFKRGGYAQILGEGREGVAQVMIEFLEGRQPSWFDISDAIHLDGRRRGLEWKLLPGESSIRKVDMNRRTKKDENFSVEADVDDALSELATSSTDETGRRKTVQDRAKTPTYGQRWILSFESVEEAKRFSLGWHGRAFPWHARVLKKWQEKGFGEQILMVRAEFLW